MRRWFAGCLILLPLIPGMPSKFLLGKGDPDCITEKVYGRFQLSPSKLFSPPVFKELGDSSHLDLFFLRGKTHKSDLNIVMSYRKPKSEVLWHSPFFYWIEQKLDTLLQTRTETRGFNDLEFLNNGGSFFKKAVDNGLIQADAIAENWIKADELSIFSGWTDRFPISFMVGKADKVSRKACPNEAITRIDLYQRGLFLPWTKAPMISVHKPVLTWLFRPVRWAADATKNPHLMRIDRFTNQIELFSVSASPPDLPMWMRFIFFSGGIYLVLSSDSKSKESIANKKAKGTWLQLLAINTTVFAFFIFASASIVDFLLSFTTLLDQTESRAPSYLPIKLEYRHRKNTWARLRDVNEYGFIDSPVAHYDKDYSCKIAILGDSFVWGAGSAPGSDERWPSQLQILLPSCKIFYWGIGGWTTRDQAVFMEKLGKKHSVDLVILGYVDNDMKVEPLETEYNMKTVSRLKNATTSPLVVLFTPWNGLASHNKYFDYAKKIFDIHGIQSLSCMPYVESVTGKNKPAPRSAWIGEKVDSHPGYPITRALAQCAFDYLDKNFVLPSKET